jgi:hypothetical protein
MVELDQFDFMYNCVCWFVNMAHGATRKGSRICSRRHTVVTTYQEKVVVKARFCTYNQV